MTLTDAERSRIRWSSTKRGFVARVEFAPLGRSRKPVRPVRSEAKTTLGDAERELKRLLASYRNPVTKAAIIEVDALGVEVDRLDYDRADMIALVERVEADDGWEA